MNRRSWLWPTCLLLAMAIPALSPVGAGTAQAQPGPRRPIDGLSAASAPRTLYAADLDADGDLDLLAASCALCGSVVVLPPQANQLAWYVNEHIVLAIGDQDERPEGYRLFPAYPNPFNPTTHLTYRLAAPGTVSIRVYDARGRFVTTLVDGMQGAGSHVVTFEAAGLPSGPYLVRLEAAGFRQAHTVTLLK